MNNPHDGIAELNGHEPRELAPDKSRNLSVAATLGLRPRSAPKVRTRGWSSDDQLLVLFVFLVAVVPMLIAFLVTQVF